MGFNFNKHHLFRGTFLRSLPLLQWTSLQLLLKHRRQGRPKRGEFRQVVGKSSGFLVKSTISMGFQEPPSLRHRTEGDKIFTHRKSFLRSNLDEAQYILGLFVQTIFCNHYRQYLLISSHFRDGFLIISVNL